MFYNTDTLVAKAQELRRRRYNLDGAKRVARKRVHEVRVQRNSLQEIKSKNMFFKKLSKMFLNLRTFSTYFSENKIDEKI